MLLDFDCHVHTYYSPCGRQTDEEGRPLAEPERHLEQAHTLGLDGMIFTDHFVEDASLPGTVLFYRSSGPAILESLRRELGRSSAGEGLNLYVGCETETMSTERVGVSPAMSAQLDFVLVPTTHYHLTGVPQPDSYAPADLADHMLTMLESVVAKPWLDSVAHPFAEREEMIGDLRRVYEAMDKSRLDDILGLAADKGVALEVNGS